MYIEGSTEALSKFPYLEASSLANTTIQRNGLASSTFRAEMTTASQGAVFRDYNI